MCVLWVLGLGILSLVFWYDVLMMMLLDLTLTRLGKVVQSPYPFCKPPKNDDGHPGEAYFRILGENMGNLHPSGLDKKSLVDQW